MYSRHEADAGAAVMMTVATINTAEANAAFILLNEMSPLTMTG